MTDSMTIGIIAGSGLGEALLDGIDPRGVKHHFPETPFGRPSGTIVTATYNDVNIAILQRHGDGHVLNPAAVPYRANIFALKELGCTHLIASGATGSLREDIHPGDLVLVDQIIDQTNDRKRTFYEHAAVHVEFAEPCCGVMRSWLLSASKTLEGQTVHETGTYVCMEGPAFSTRAESELHRQWGADLIGMTAVPEAKLAREAEMAYALVSLPTDYDCWKPRDQADQQSLLLEIIGNLQKATQASINLIRAALDDVSRLRENPSSAHDALKLAIWSDKTKIDRAEVDRLRPLWGRHI
ncbi:MAG: MTAP family purine nucleoside phosphorylase [Planctomycetes bacterium]|nr:MTAP family purine nucleoside phosphorylase [Planctomycetota bacterium]